MYNVQSKVTERKYQLRKIFLVKMSFIFNDLRSFFLVAKQRT